MTRNETVTELAQFPHCDQRVLHAPSECEFCDRHPDWQALRQAWGIAFTGHLPRASLPECGESCSWDGTRRWKCRQAKGHDEGGNPTIHSPQPEHEAMWCPADAARPQDSSADHRRWGGNKPTSAGGDPSWPAETAASRVMYGDKGGREPWPLPERIRRRMRRPLDDWRRVEARGRLVAQPVKVVHVHPVADLIEHEMTGECPCGPRQEPVERDDGSTGWVVVHHSLDGREETQGVER